MAATGVAFSGGGIRSAAFCSGVLRRLLQKSVSVDFLSCVSGGGFTGTAYLDWKSRNDNRDKSKWHSKFFDRMRSEAGYICNWQRPCRGFVDCFKVTALVIVGSIVLPWITWGSYAIPFVYAIDCLFGDLLRSEILRSSNALETNQETLHGGLTQTYQTKKNKNPDQGMRSFSWDLGTLPCLIIFICVVITLIASLVYVFSRPFYKLKTTICTVLSGIIKFFISFLLIPWFINAHFVKVPLWIQVLAPPICSVVWIFLPVYRHTSSTVLTVYLYAYVIYWRVYRRRLLGVTHSPVIYGYLLCASGLVMFLAPMVEEFRRWVTYIHFRSQLQRAFYSDVPAIKTRCNLVSRALQQSIICRNRDEDAFSLHKPLNLSDLEDVKPQFISNVAVRNWKRNNYSEPGYYELLTMSPTEIETIDRQPGFLEFDELLEPEDINVCDAMALSADGQRNGALSLMGLRFWSTVEYGAHFRSGPTSFTKAVSFLIQLFLVAPVISFSVFFFISGKEAWAAIGVFSYTLLITSLVVITLMGACAEQKKEEECDRLLSWFTRHVPHVRYIREYTHLVKLGPGPPDLIQLADGGHVENLGILPLLKRRLRRIVVVNGGLTNLGNHHYCADDLLKALQLARAKLRCSFQGITGRDIVEDIRSNLLEMTCANQTGCYRFRVSYYTKESEKDCERKVGEGEILYVIPRRREFREDTNHRTWKEYGMDLDADLWGAGPELDASEASHLTCCCCQCCHRVSLQGPSECLFGAFPYHSDANQFFTPTLFAAYHRQGYSACAEARVLEFLDDV